MAGLAAEDCARRRAQEEGARKGFFGCDQGIARRGWRRARNSSACGSTRNFKEIPDSDFELRADLVLLAMGFVSPVHEGLLESLGVGFDPRGNVLADQLSYKTSIPKIFACGDMRRGQSLIVWAIREGRQAAHAVDLLFDGIDGPAPIKRFRRSAQFAFLRSTRLCCAPGTLPFPVAYRDRFTRVAWRAFHDQDRIAASRRGASRLRPFRRARRRTAGWQTGLLFPERVTDANARRLLSGYRSMPDLCCCDLPDQRRRRDRRARSGRLWRGDDHSGDQHRQRRRRGRRPYGRGSGGNGVTINAGASDSVHLRGLTIEGTGVGVNGIQFKTGGNLAIENCVVRNFTLAGIRYHAQHIEQLLGVEYDCFRQS